MIGRVKYNSEVIVTVQKTTGILILLGVLCYNLINKRMVRR